ncbi:MAG: adenylyltransferase/cytidyltransferase family protein [Promethearchaeota archaeon]
MTRKRVVVAGTFDILHPGHIFLISEAAKIGDVIVVIARDKNVLRTKGRPPIIPEGQRLFMVQSLKGVSQAILGYESADNLQIIEELNPDILLLGPNQNVSLEEIQIELQRRGLKTRVQRLEELYKDYPLSSTSGIIEKIRIKQKSEP